MKKIVIIGGGPAGMMAAISAKKHFPDAKVCLLEKNEELGKKLKITGGGRCNITANVSTQDVVQSTPKNGKFLYSALSHFGPNEIQEFFKTNGCPLKVEDHQRVFPKSDKSKDIINTLQQKILALNIEIEFNTIVHDVNIEKKELYLENDSKIISFDYLILTTGGKTYPQTGSNGSGYLLAEKLGHTITELLPAEVPLVSSDLVIADKTLQGLSFQDVALSVLNHKNKKVICITHDLLFTHFGVSGPAALRASFYVQKILAKQKQCLIAIDFLPEYSSQQLEQELKQKQYNKLGLPKRFINYVMIQAQDNLSEIMTLIKAFPLTIYDTRGFQQAFVTNGGISLKEIAPQTLKSKRNPFVSFAGEILDISAYTGGFNITGALATGYTAGKFVIDEMG